MTDNSTASGYERRLNMLLVQYWNKIRGERELPSEDDIDPDELIGVWERCFMVQLRDLEQVQDYNYSYYGPELISAYQDGRLYESDGKLAAPDARSLAELFEDVIEEQGPVMHEGEYTDANGRLVKYRQALVPLGMGDKIMSILGGGWFKHF